MNKPVAMVTGYTCDVWMCNKTSTPMSYMSSYPRVTEANSCAVDSEILSENKLRMHSQNSAITPVWAPHVPKYIPGLDPAGMCQCSGGGWHCYIPRADDAHVVGDGDEQEDGRKLIWSSSFTNSVLQMQSRYSYIYAQEKVLKIKNTTVEYCQYVH